MHVYPLNFLSDGSRGAIFFFIHSKLFNHTGVMLMEVTLRGWRLVVRGTYPVTGR